MTTQEYKDLIKSVLGTDAGQQLLLVLDSRFNARSSFVPNDPYTTAFNEGQRSVVLELLSSYAPDVPADTEE